MDLKIFIRVYKNNNKFKRNCDLFSARNKEKSVLTQFRFPISSTFVGLFVPAYTIPSETDRLKPKVKHVLIINAYYKTGDKCQKCLETSSFMYLLH